MDDSGSIWAGEMDGEENKDDDEDDPNEKEGEKRSVFSMCARKNVLER